MVGAVLLMLLVTIDPPKPPPARMTHLRPVSEIAQRIVSDATRASPTVVSMIAEIEQSDLIVYLDVTTGAGAEIGATRLAGANASVRFLYVTINLTLDPHRRVAILAHELQHVLEVAGAPDVRDAAGMQRLFERIGHSLGRQQYETSAATDVERAVDRELWISRARSQKPKVESQKPNTGR